MEKHIIFLLAFTALFIAVYGTNKRSAAGDTSNPKKSKKSKNADKQKSQTSRVENSPLLSTDFAQRMNELVQTGMYRQRPLSTLPKEQRRQVWNEIKPKKNRGRDLQGSPSLVTNNVNTQTNDAGSSHFPNVASRVEELEKRQEELERVSWLEQLDKKDGGIFRDSPGTPPPSW